jgi:hypothetical protein
MSSLPLPAPSAALAGRLRDAVGRYRTLVTRLSRIEEAASTLELELVQLQDALVAVPRAAVPSTPGTSATRAVTLGSDVLRRAAEAGVASVTLERRSDGSADARIDAGAPFRLAPGLADLLSVLVTDTEDSVDALVGWKRLDEVAMLLAQKGGRSMTRHGVTQKVHRLRHELLQRGGVNPFLVQTNRRRGVRFALRRRPAEES